MKHRFSSILCLLLIFCLICSVTVTAYASEIEQQTVISYTKIGEPIQEEPEESKPPVIEEQPNVPLYEISIPSEMSLNNGSTLPIYLLQNNLAEGQTLYVYIDGTKSYADDGLLHLRGANTQEDAKVLINRYDTDGSYMAVTQLPCPTVAVFQSGNVRPVKYGTISFVVIDEENLAPDTYTGNLYFTFSITNS